MHPQYVRKSSTKYHHNALKSYKWVDGCTGILLRKLVHLEHISIRLVAIFVLATPPPG